MAKSMRKKLLLCGFAGLLVLLSLTAAAADVLVGSWNIRHLGHGDAKDFEAVAYVASRYDLLAVQEAMTEEGLRKLETELEAATNEGWGLLYSHAIGRGSYKELYGFLWRESRVKYLDGAVVYVDEADRFAREPFSGRFGTVDGSAQWVMAAVHVLYGDSRADRVPEARALATFWDWLRETFPEVQSVVLAGDFNLPPYDPAFRPLKERARPLIVRGATTLSSIDGRYANLYDNLFVNPDHELDILESGIDRFPERIGWSHKQARRHISDHAPVFMRIAVPGSFPARGVAESNSVKGKGDGGDRPSRVVRRLLRPFTVL